MLRGGHPGPLLGPAASGSVQGRGRTVPAQANFGPNTAPVRPQVSGAYPRHVFSPARALGRTRGAGAELAQGADAGWHGLVEPLTRVDAGFSAPWGRGIVPSRPGKGLDRPA